MCVAPAARPASKNCIAGGMVAAGFGPDEQDRFASAMSARGKGQPAIDTERAIARGRRRGHAESAVVVDHGGQQRHPRKLAERVGFLVGQPPAPRSSRRRRGHTSLGWHGFRRRRGQRVRPSWPLGTHWCGHREPYERAGSPDAVHDQKRCRGPALRTEPATVGREVKLRLQTGGSIPSNDGNAALQRAVRTVRRGGGSAHLFIVRERCYSTCAMELRPFHQRLTLHSPECEDM